MILRRRLNLEGPGSLLFPPCKFLNLLVLLSCWSGAAAELRSFQIGGVTLNLEEVTEHTGVYYSSMRFNRALNAWNVEVTVSNRSARAISGPVLLLVQNVTGSSGVIAPDGNSAYGPFYDLTPRIQGSTLFGSQSSLARTLTIAAVPNQAPKLTTRVYCAPGAVGSLAFTRTLNEAGQPLGAADVEETGPAGRLLRVSDPVFGGATLGTSEGQYVWKFSAPGYLPAWRKLTLGPEGMDTIPYPRLMPISLQQYPVGPLNGGVLSNAAIAVFLEPYSISLNTTGSVTALDGQTLPFPLPLGWSPLQAFAVDLGAPVSKPGAAEASLWGPLNQGERAAFARFDQNNLTWRLVQAIEGQAGTSITNLLIPGPGTYVIAVSDGGIGGPQIPANSEALPGLTAAVPSAANLSAGGSVLPPTSPASRVPELVTGNALLVVTNSAGPLPSGTVLRGEVSEIYSLRDGSRRKTPGYDSFLYAYQRPGDTRPETLHARFPMRPLLLFGPEVLNEAVVRMQVFAAGPFTGGVLDPAGGTVADQEISLLAGAGVLTSRQLVHLRRVSPTNFVGTVPTNLPIVAAFELGIGGVASGSNLVLRITGLRSNADFVLARVLVQEGLFGLEPAERMATDALGNLKSAEPSIGPRLDGLTSAGQYVLCEIEPRQAVVYGIARNLEGEPAEGLVVRITGQPWLTFSKTGGVYKLLAPAGEATVTVADHDSGDEGSHLVQVLSTLNPVNLDAATRASGPQVIATAPADNATSVPRVTTVTVDFSEPVNTGSFVQHPITITDTNGQPVATTVTLNLSNQRATLIPSGELEPGMTYIIRASTNITDLIGRPLEGPREFRFTTLPLSQRDAGAQLIVYEPGATNVPPELLAQVPGYRPGQDKTMVVVRGTGGAADPGQPVILVNESSGQTVTVLSKTDGSFVSLIEATEQDFISATFVSLNNQRVYIPVSRQLFDNGFVGLYRQGGILEAQSDGGPVHVLVAPNGVATRTKFKLETLSAAELQQALGGVTPQGAIVAGNALKIRVEGPPPIVPMQARFPVDLAEVGYPTNQAPADAVLALTAVREVQGVKAFEVLDQLQFEPGPSPSRGPRKTFDSADFAGALFTVAGFTPSLGISLVPLVYDFIVVPTLMLGNKPVVITGKTFYFQVGDPGQEEKFVDRQMLSGTYVVLRGLPAPPIGAPGRLQPGWVYASSDQNGTYKMVAPFAGIDYLLTATHPGFQDQPSTVISDLIHKGGDYHDFIFKNPFTNQITPRVTVANAPQYPAADQTTQIHVNAAQAIGGPPEVRVSVDSFSTNSLLTGLVETNIQVVLTNGTTTTSGNNTLWTGTLSANKPIRVTLKIEVTGREPVDPIYFPVNFAGVPPPPTNNVIPPPDEHDIHGPLVIMTQPVDSGYLDASGSLRIFFNKPIDQSLVQNLRGITITGPGQGVTPILRLSPDQQVLTLQLPGLEPNGEYRVTLTGQGVRDLAGQPMDQRPTTAAPDSFSMLFRAPPVLIGNLPNLENGRGAVISGKHLYALDQSGQGNYLVTYDISIPSTPRFLTRYPLLGAPRDLVLIPQFSYVTSIHSSVKTNDLLAVVGGDLDTVILEDPRAPIVRGRGQYLAVLDVGNPSGPVQLASPIVSYRVGSAVTKVRWQPPFLIYEEFGADIQQLALVDLQEMLIGFGSPRGQQETFPPGGKPGRDLNGDGDYVDADEVLPLPDGTAAEFFGKKQSFVLQHSTQKILDFSISQKGTLGVTLKSGRRLDSAGQPQESLTPSYRTFSFGGQLLNLSNPTNAAYQFDQSAYPRWVTILEATEVVSNGVPHILPALALVSLSPDSDQQQKLAIIDITLPLEPKLLNKIPLPESLLGGAAQSLERRADGTLAIAGSQHVLLLDPAYLLVTNVPAGQLHASIVGTVPAAGGITRSLGSTDYGVSAVADGGRGRVVQTTPTMMFIGFPEHGSVVDAQSLHIQDESSLVGLMQKLRPLSYLPPAQVSTNFDISSGLNPPNPALHYHVLMKAPGDSGIKIELGLEAVNVAGRPLSNPGRGFAPVRAIADSTQGQIGQRPKDNCGTPIRSLPAYRMSDDPHSAFYNMYLSRPFAMVAERTSPEQLEELRQLVDREILFGGFALRTFIEPAERLANPVIGQFAAEVNDSRKLIYPIATATALTLDNSYLMGDNPPPSGGTVKMDGTHGTVAAHSGELRTDFTDIGIPSPRFPIEIKRTIGSQDNYEGPFGVGWDFNYNQRITELTPELFPQGLQMPMIVRGTKEDSDIAGSQDVLFHTGVGRAVMFRWIDNEMPPEYREDPLVRAFDYAKLASDYYLPAPRQGVFDLLVKFRDGRFERLTPEGLRFRYAPNGRLESVIDSFPLNRHELAYDENGWLIQITDVSVTSDRFVRFGYYRRASDPGFTSGLDERTDQSFVEGKICRLQDYAGGDVLFQYSHDGFLTNRLGKLVAGENGGFSGRSQILYSYQNCQIVSVSVSESGTPVASTVNVANSRGKQVANRLSGLGMDTEMDIPSENTAASLAGAISSSKQPDGTTTFYTFDKWGHLTESTVVGLGESAATTRRQFNEDGLPQLIVQPEGNSQAMVYDSGNPVFRSRGNLLKVTVNPGPRGGGAAFFTEMQYDPRYNLIAGPQRNGNGKTSTVALRPDGREILSINHGTAGTEFYTHNEKGQLLSHTDVRGVVKNVRYQGSTGFVQAEAMGTSDSAHSYDSSYAARLGNATTITPPEGAALSLRYNANLHAVEIRQGALVEHRGFDEQSRMIYQRQELGDGKELITRHQYDARGFLERTINEGVEVDGMPTTLETRFTPDALARVRLVHHPEGAVQQYSYDSRGNITNITLGDYSQDYSYDKNDNIIAIAEGGEVVQTIAYNGFDQATTVTRRTGDLDYIESYTYFPEGQPKSVRISDSEFGLASEEICEEVDELGRPMRFKTTGTTISPTLTHTYAPLRLTKTGPRTTTEETWDAAGFQSSAKDSLSEIVYTVDAAGRVSSLERREDGATFNQEFDYDEYGNTKGLSDALGQVFASRHRPTGHLLATTNAVGHFTLLEQSALGEPISIKRQDGMTKIQRYNAHRNASYQGDPGAGFKMIYDSSFRLKTSTLRSGIQNVFDSFDGRSMPQAITTPGGSIELRFDLQKRETERIVTYQQTTYETRRRHDALGRQRVVTYKQDSGALNEQRFDYDPAGPLLSQRIQEDGLTFTVNYTHYDDRTRKTIQYPSGVTVTEDRDEGGRLLGIADANGSIYRAETWHGVAQPRDIRLGAAIRIQNQYDARGRITGSRATRVSSGAVLTHMRYEYDAANNLLARQFVHRGLRTDAFDYDTGERLQKARMAFIPTPANAAALDPLYQRTYAYDPSGLDYLTTVTTTNLRVSLPPFASTWTAHDAFLQPTAVDNHTRGAAGPLGFVQGLEIFPRRQESGSLQAKGAILTHNGKGNLIKVETADGVTVENYYQPNGLRYARKIFSGGGTEHRHYVYDSQDRLLEEYERTGGRKLVARYYYGDLDSPEAADILDFSAGVLRRYYFLKEPNQSIIAIADSSGVVLERYWHDPFGQPSIQQRDISPPVIRSVRAGSDGALLIEFSEPIFARTNDPGPGSGLVVASANLNNIVSLSTTNGVAAGTVELLANLGAFEPYSVLRFAPTGAIGGPITLSLNPGSVQDEWSNTNAARALSLTVTGGVGTVYFAAQPDERTGPSSLLRSAIGNPFLFHGQFFDYETGLVYLRARFYDPFAGMFLEPDPLGYEDSVNLYAGLLNNPVNVRDPSGLAGESWLRVAVRLFDVGNVEKASEALKLANFSDRVVGMAGLKRNSELVRATLEGILDNSKLGSSIVGAVRPRAAQMDMSLRAAWIEVAKSPEFKRAIDAYNTKAKLLGVKTSVSAGKIIKALKKDTLFALTGAESAAVWSANDLPMLGKFWLQGPHPLSGLSLKSGATGKQAAMHELLHMGAILNGQEAQIANAYWVNKNVFNYFTLMSNPYYRHELAVQLSSTYVTGTIAGIGYVAQPIVAAGFGYVGYQMGPGWWAWAQGKTGELLHREPSPSRP